MRELDIRLMLDGPTRAWGIGSDEPDSRAIEAAVKRHLEGESITIGQHVVVIDSIGKPPTIGKVQQDMENEQVRIMNRTGRCPCCGSEQ